MAEWDAEAIINAIDMELTATELDDDGNEVPLNKMDPEAMARANLRRKAPVIMESLIWLATRSASESVRLRAASYLNDHLHGRSSDVPLKDSSKSGNKMQELLDSVVRPVSN